MKAQQYTIPSKSAACRAWSACFALGLQATVAGPALAQSLAAEGSAERSRAYQERIAAVARDFADNPRFKGLTQQQRVDRVEFVVGNTLFVLLHEMGHVHVTEMRLPVLGRDEDAADSFAALTLLKVGSDLSQRVLADSAKGWFLSDRRDRQLGAPLLFYDEHGLNQQRAYQIVCLMVGSDPEKFKDLARETKMPDARQRSCEDEYERAAWSWETALAPHRRIAGQPKTDISVEYESGQGIYDVYVNSFRSIRLLETVAAVAAEQYVWPTPFKLVTEVCGHPGAHWENKTHILTVCYEQAHDFAELYRAYGALPLEASTKTTSTNKNRKSR